MTDFVSEEDKKKAEEWKKEQDKKKVELTVSVDNSTTAEVMKENAELRQKVLTGEKSVNEKLGEQIKTELKNKYEQLGLQCPKLETEEDMTNAVEIFKQLQERHRFPESPPSGSAPLSPEQYGKGSERGFENYEQMVDFLRFQEKSSDKMVSNEATEILNALMGKALKRVFREDRKMPDYEEPLPELKQVGNLKVRSNSEDDPFNQKRIFRDKQKAQKGET